jgi:hypothetical protein
MAIVVSLIGHSGTGKTYSMRNVVGSETCMVLKPSGKPFSFRKKLKQYDKQTKKGDYISTVDYTKTIALMKALVEPPFNKKILIVEDSSFWMTNFFMDTISEKGFDKFSNNASGYYNMLKTAESLPEDVVVYFVNHIDEDPNGGKKVKTIGKMLDEKIDILSLLTISLETKLKDKNYYFQTNKVSSLDLCKSPVGMFDDTLIENDLMMVDKAIREYYYLDEVEYAQIGE